MLVCEGDCAVRLDVDKYECRGDDDVNNRRMQFKEPEEGVFGWFIHRALTQMNLV